MAYVDLVAAVGVFLPTAALIWFFLGRYEGYFEDRRLFFAMGVGVFAALVVRFMQVRLFGFDMPYIIQQGGPPFTSGTLVYSFAYTTVGYGMLVAMAMTAILGFKKFRMRKDSAYYGTALGLALGAMWATEFIAAPSIIDGRGLVTASGHLVTTPDALVYDAILFALGIGMVLVHGAAGTWVGRSCGEGRLVRAASQGTFWLAVAYAMEWFWLNSHEQTPAVLAALAALAWGIFALAFVDKRVLQTIVPPEVRDMVRKERRREMRKAP